MSSSIRIESTQKEWVNLRFNSLDATGSSGTSCLVGYDGSEFFATRLGFTTPSQEENVTITSIAAKTLEFGIVSDTQFPWTTYGGGGTGGSDNNWNVANSDKEVYGLFLPVPDELSPNPTLREIQQHNETFLLSGDFYTQQRTLSFVINKNLSPGVSYYLYIFTKNPGGSGKRLWYYWPNNSAAGFSTLTYESTTYTKLIGPNDTWIDGIIKPHKQNLAISANPSTNLNEWFDYYLLTWRYQGQGEILGSAKINAASGWKYNLNLEEDKGFNRGSLVSFEAQAIHKKDAAFNSEVKSVGQVTVNSLPIIERFFVDSQTTLPQQRAIKIRPKMTIGDANATQNQEKSQTIKGYFKINSGNYLESGSEVEISYGDIIYYYATDGLENTEVLAKKIDTGTIENLTVNIPPKLTNVVFSYAFSENRVAISATKSKKSKYELQANMDGRYGAWKEVEENVAQLENLTDGRGFKKVLLRARLKDDYGDTSEASESYELFRPYLTPSKNFLGSIVINGLNYPWRIEVENFPIAHSISDPNTEGEAFINISNPNDLEPNTAYPFNVGGIYNGIKQWIWDEYADEKGEKYTPITSNFAKFTAPPSFTGDPINPWEAWLNEEAGNFSISTKIRNQTQQPEVNVILSRNGVKKSLGTLDSSISGEFLQVNPSLKSFFDFGEYKTTGTFENSFGALKGLKVPRLHLEYTQDGAIIKSEQVDFPMTFDYLNSPPTPAFKNLYQGKIREGTIPTIQLNSWPMATAANIKVILYVDKGRGYEKYEEKTIERTTTSFTVDSSGRLILGTLDREETFPTVGEISESQNWKWKIEAILQSDNKLSEFSNIADKEVIKHIAPSGFILGQTTWNKINDKDQATVNFTVDWGSNLSGSGDFGVSAILIAGESSSGEIKNFSKSSFNFIPEVTSGPYTIALRITSTIGGVTKTKDFTGFKIYKDGPTIAYRYHQLGINTTDLEENIALSIQPFENKKVLFLGAGLQIVNGVIDCGSWTGINGGVVGGGASYEPSEKLAAIAYTGKITHLEQDAQDEIITFYGGSAPAESSEPAESEEI